MKKPDAFDRKRKVRDKANLRWVKSRHLVTPSFVALGFAGGTLAATLASDLGPEATAAAAIAGMFAAIVVGGPYVVRTLCK